MENTKTIIAGVVAIILIGGLFVLSNKPTTNNVVVNPSPVTVNQPPQTTNLGDTIVYPSNVTVNPVTGEPVLGALPSNEVSSNYFSIGDVAGWWGRYAMTQAASTTCSHYIEATSTLERFSIKFDGTATSTSMGLVLATSTLNNMSTTTFLYGAGVNMTGDDWVTTGGQDSFTFIPTTTAKRLLKKGTYLNLGIFGAGTAGTGARVGAHCTVVTTYVR